MVRYFLGAAFFFGAAFFAGASGFAAAFSCTAAAVIFRAVSVFRLARVSLLLATVFPVPLFPLRSLARFVVMGAKDSYEGIYNEKIRISNCELRPCYSNRNADQMVLSTEDPKSHIVRFFFSHAVDGPMPNCSGTRPISGNIKLIREVNSPNDPLQLLQIIRIRCTCGSYSGF